MHISDDDNAIHGSKYYKHGYNGYAHIETCCGNSTGTMNLMNGIKTGKLADEILRKVNTVQSESYAELILSNILGQSGNSKDLYLYATTTGKLYTERFKDLISGLRELLDKRGTDFERFSYGDIYSLQGILWSLVSGFSKAAEMYHKELKPKNSWDKTFTPLDIYFCAAKWLDFYINEYKINGLK